MTFTRWASLLRAAPEQPAAGAGEFTLIDTHTHFYDPNRPEGVPGRRATISCFIARCCPRITEPCRSHGP
jgi:hypothetical protein